MVDDCRIKRVKFRVRSAEGQCFGLVIVPPIHLGAFSILENKLIGNAGDSTLIAIVSSPGVELQ